MYRMKRFYLLGLFAIFVVSLVGAACGDDDDDEGGTATPGGGGEPNRGGEVTIAYPEPASFDPHYSSFAQDIGVQRMVWRGLYKLNGENQAQPEMAAALPEVSEDGKTYTIELKADLKWSDGDDLTADDFVAGIQRTCNPDNAGQYKDTIGNIVGCNDYYNAADASDAEKETLRNAVGVKALSPTKLEITLANPQPTFTQILSLWMTFPSPSHIVTDPGMPWPDVTELAYNGPFMIESYTPKDSTVVVRNDNYAGEAAYLDKITMRYIDQLDVAENAYRADQLQVTRANLTNLNAIKADPVLGKEFIQVGGVTTRAVHMNLNKEPLDNYLVRLALSQATDRETLNTVAFQGAYIPSTTWMPPAVVGGGVTEDSFSDVVGFDPEAAKENLAEAGYPNGEGFPVLTITVNDVPDRRVTAEFLKEQWKQILNIDINIDVVDSATRSQRFSAEDYELFPGGWTQDYPDPENWVAGLFNSDGANNHYGIADDDLDALFEKAFFNTNDEERREQYRQINEMLSSDPLLAGPVLYQESFNYLIKPNLYGPREFVGPTDAHLAGDWNVEAWYLKE